MQHFICYLGQINNEIIYILNTQSIHFNEIAVYFFACFIFYVRIRTYQGLKFIYNLSIRVFYSSNFDNLVILMVKTSCFDINYSIRIWKVQQAVSLI